MFRNLHPKCANPTCVATFEWLAGGKLFRFHRNSETTPGNAGSRRPVDNSHHVEHFWLCERCAHVYTLTYDPERDVSIRLLWPVLPAAQEHLQLPVS